MGGDFTTNLKKSANIAIVAKATLGLESLCAAVALSELINKFLETEKDYLVSVYYLDDIPKEASDLTQKIKIYTKIGEKTVYIKFPAETIEKVTYSINEKSQEFELGLIGFKGKRPVKNLLKIVEEEERFEMVVGVGYDGNKELVELVPYTKKFENHFIFNKSNLIGDNLVDGVMDLFLKEKVKPTKLSALSFATYYSSIGN